LPQRLEIVDHVRHSEADLVIVGKVTAATFAFAAAQGVFAAVPNVEQEYLSRFQHPASLA
jgi:hypothetical protein